MILIDKQKPQQQLFLTLTEKTSVETPVYVLALSNDAQKAITNISLDGKLVSTNPRYDYYLLDTSDFDGLPGGFYTYSIYEDESSIVEFGKLFIKEIEASVELISPIKTDEYLIYK